MRDIVSRAVVLLIILKSDPDTDFIFRLYLVSVFINDRNIKQAEILHRAVTLHLKTSKPKSIVDSFYLQLNVKAFTLSVLQK